MTMSSVSCRQEQRTRLVAHQLGLGCWTRATRAADPRLQPLLHRAYVGFEHRHAGLGRWLEPPRPALTLMIDLQGGLRADGVALPGAWVGGLSDTYSVVELGNSYASLDLQLTPLGAYTVLGRPLHQLAGAIVGIEDVVGVPGRRLVERLHDLSGWDRRFDAIEAFLLERAANGPQASPAVTWALARLRATAGRARIESLAAELGCSRRYLHARVREQIGVPPKTLARLLRFEDVCRRIDDEPARWADIAHDAGYCDQSHLNRDFRELAGTTPTDFLARRIPGGGLIGDEIPFVQDTRKDTA